MRQAEIVVMAEGTQHTLPWIAARVTEIEKRSIIKKIKKTIKEWKLDLEFQTDEELGLDITVFTSYDDDSAKTIDTEI
jgi:hypothetical protein